MLPAFFPYAYLTDLSHSTMSAKAQKLILVIGATGAQGIAVIDALLKSAPDGSLCPYSVRALTRDAKSARAQDLAGRGVELVQGTSAK